MSCVHNSQILAHALVYCTCLQHPVICSKGNKRKMFAVFLSLPAKKGLSLKRLGLGK